MVKITLTSQNEDDPTEVSASGENFSVASVELLKNLLLNFSWIHFQIFNGLSILAENNQDGVTEDTFEHRDFSMPEDNFDLTFISEE